MKVWTCKIGTLGKPYLRPGADLPMRHAVERAYREVVGEPEEFVFSGWGGALDEVELAAHENRLPDCDVWIAELEADIAEKQALLREIKAAR